MATVEGKVWHELVEGGVAKDIAASFSRALVQNLLGCPDPDVVAIVPAPGAVGQCGGVRE